MSGKNSGQRLGNKRAARPAVAMLAFAALLCGCQGPGYGTPDWNWAPGSGARIAPPVTGRGAYGSPDPYYQNSPAANATGSSRRADDRLYSRTEAPNDSVSRAEYVDRGPWKSGGRKEGSLRLKGGMPKSGEPRRLQIQDDLTELTDLPASQGFGSPAQPAFGVRTPRSGATLMSPNSRSRRTPYREDYDRDLDEDHLRAATTADACWRQRD